MGRNPTSAGRAGPHVGQVVLHVVQVVARQRRDREDGAVAAPAGPLPAGTVDGVVGGRRLVRGQHQRLPDRGRLLLAVPAGDGRGVLVPVVGAGGGAGHTT